MTVADVPDSTRLQPGVVPGQTMATADDTGFLATTRATDAAVALVVLTHLVALVVFPDGPPLSTLLALEGVTGLGLVGAGRIDGIPVRQAIGLLVPFVVFLAGAWGLLWVGTSTLVTALVLGGSVGLVAYTLHRYELVSLGLVEDVE